MARDRAEKARALVESEGMTFKTETTGAVHVHPAVRIEKDATATFMRAWKALGLEWSYQEADRS